MTEHRSCLVCGSPTPERLRWSGRARTYCSALCKRKAKAARRRAAGRVYKRAPQPAHKRPKIERTCGVCARQFLAPRDYRKGRGSYCSRRCVASVGRNSQRAQFALDRLAQEASVPGGACVEMKRETLFGSSGQSYYAAYFGPKKCVVCGAPHPRQTGGPGRRACCDGCRPAHERRLRERRRATMNRAKHRRRQRSGPFPWGAYRDTDVFAADGWTCWLCARPVSRDVDPCAPDRATIDHVLPLNGETVSGLDVRGNVRTACRACNVAKGAQLVACG